MNDPTPIPPDLPGMQRSVPPGWTSGAAARSAGMAPGEDLEARLVKLEALVAHLLTEAGRAAGPRAGGVGVAVFNVEPEVAAAFRDRIMGVQGGRVTVLTRPDLDRPGRTAIDVRVRLERPS